MILPYRIPYSQGIFGVSRELPPKAEAAAPKGPCIPQRRAQQEIRPPTCKGMPDEITGTRIDRRLPVSMGVRK
jgi:hypothetical protein